MVSLQNSHNHLVSSLTVSVGSVTFLPQKFSSSNERSWMLKFPSDNIWPLVYSNWQVSMRVHPLVEGWIHNGLRRWSDGDRLLKVRLSWFSYPSDLWGKTLNMVFLFTKGIFGDKHWEVAIWYISFLEFLVKISLNTFPDKERPWS